MRDLGDPDLSFSLPDARRQPAFLIVPFTESLEQAGGGQARDALVGEIGAKQEKKPRTGNQT